MIESEWVYVELDGYDVTLAAGLGMTRQAINRNSHPDPIKASDDVNGYRADFYGVLGELPGCKYWNVCPDFTVTNRKGGYDFKVGDWRIDAKGTMGRPKFLFTKKYNKAVDAYVLTDTSRFPVTHLVGWISANDLFQPQNMMQSKHGHYGYGVPWEKLNVITKECFNGPVPSIAVDLSAGSGDMGASDAKGIPANPNDEDIFSGILE